MYFLMFTAYVQRGVCLVNFKLISLCIKQYIFFLNLLDTCSVASKTKYVER
jgi:hypothetical protein